MSVNQSIVNHGYWLYVDGQRVNLPVNTGRAMTWSGAFRLARSVSGVGITPPDPATDYQDSAFTAAQNLALDDLTAKARAARAAIAAVDLPSGDLLALMKVAQPSSRSFWTGSAERLTTDDKYQVSGVNLSQPQVNRSNDLVASGTSDIDEGTYTFSVTVDEGETVEVDLTVDYSTTFPDDNRAILNRLAQVIEMADSNLEAWVETGTTLDENYLAVETVALRVATRQAAEGRSFSLADTSGDLIETLDLAPAYYSGRDLTYLSGTAQSTPYGPVTSDFYYTDGDGPLTAQAAWFAGDDNRQVNRSVLLDPDGQADLADRHYRFLVSGNGNSAEVELDIDYTGYFPDDNLAILNRLAGQINETGLGLTARVITPQAQDEDDQWTAGVGLVVSGPDDGQFNLTDLQGNLVSGLGLDRVYRPAVPASISVAGWGNSRSTDAFDLDETRLQTQVHQMFHNPESLTVLPAGETVVDQVKTAAGRYNSFMAALGAAGRFVDPVIAQELARDLIAQSPAYAQVGLAVNSLGRVGVSDEFEAGLERDVPQVRERLFGDQGLLTIIDRHLAGALSGGLAASRVHLPGGRVYTSTATGGQGFDPFALGPDASDRARLMMVVIMGRAALGGRLA